MSVVDRRRIHATTEFARSIDDTSDSKRKLEEIEKYITSKYPRVGHNLIKKIQPDI